MAETEFDYDSTLRADSRSRERLTIAAAYVNVAMRAAPSMEELKDCYTGPITVTSARAIATMTNLAFAFEVALKGKISEDRLEDIRKNHRQKQHNLKFLFSHMPKIEQEQLRMCVKDILIIDDTLFDKLMDYCQDGFQEWRYFYEKQYIGRKYAYHQAVVFLYASVYYLLVGEEKGHLLEESDLRRRSYIGESSLLAQYKKVELEFEEAKRVSLKDGNGTISDFDAEWLKSIIDRLKGIVDQIQIVAKQYDEGNTDFNRERN